MRLKNEWALVAPLFGEEPSRRAEATLEREKGFEPSTSTLARLHSTTELFPQQDAKNYPFRAELSRLSREAIHSYSVRHFTDTAAAHFCVCESLAHSATNFLRPRSPAFPTPNGWLSLKVHGSGTGNASCPKWFGRGALRLPGAQRRFCPQPETPL